MIGKYGKRFISMALLSVLLCGTFGCATTKEQESSVAAGEVSSATIKALEGKSALFLGDSITYGMCDYYTNLSTGGWAGRIGYYCGMTVKNNGVNGACISSGRSSNEAAYIYNNLAKEKGNSYDYIIMHGLYNDAGTGVPVGTAKGCKDFHPEQVDESTFAGGLELLFYTAKQDHPTSKLGFIINFRTEDGVNCDAHVAKAIEICEEWDIPYLDFYNDGTEVKLFDGLHPTAVGYDQLYPRIADWMATLE